MRFDQTHGTCAPAQRAGFLRACRRATARCADAGHLTDANRPRPPRGLSVLAAAFGQAAEHAPDSALCDTLVERQEEIDPTTTLYALRSLVDLWCHQTGETPRTLLEAEFVGAPSDDFWRANLSEATA